MSKHGRLNSAGCRTTWASSGCVEACVSSEGVEPSVSSGSIGFSEVYFSLRPWLVDSKNSMEEWVVYERAEYTDYL